MAMALPELFSKNSHVTLLVSSYLINKYKHLINWKTEPSILEFGYADGATSQVALNPLIPKDYKEFTAADISKPMLKYAKKSKLNPRAEFLPLDIGTKNISDGLKCRYDHIFSFCTMQLVKEASQAFKNIHSMLKTEGETFHIFFKVGPLDDVFHQMSKHPRWGKYGQDAMISPYYYEKDPIKCFKKDLVDAGFKEIHLREDNLSYEYPNMDFWKGNYLAVNAVLSKIPKTEVEEYTEYYFETIKDVLFSNVNNVIDGKYPTLYFSVLTVSAKK